MPADDKLDLLKQMIALIGEVVLEGERRAHFQELCSHYDGIAARPRATTKRAAKKAEPEEPLPDIHEAFRMQSREDFLVWAAALDPAVLKRIVKAEQFDPAGRAKNWRKPEKFAELIYDQLAGRGERGAGFQRAASA